MTKNMIDSKKITFTDAFFNEKYIIKLNLFENFDFSLFFRHAIFVKFSNGTISMIIESRRNFAKKNLIKIYLVPVSAI